MHKKPLKINFFVPFLNKTGGILVVLEYAKYLKDEGHDVAIYHPLIPYWSLLPKNCPLYKKIYSMVRSIFSNLSKIDWFDSPASIKAVFRFWSPLVRKADICVATAWPTAFDVSRLNKSKGVKFYFIQGYEIWGNKKDLAKKSYTLPLHLITISPWLTEIMSSVFYRGIVAEIHNGIRSDLTNSIRSVARNGQTVLMLYSSLECKGSKEGLIALSMLKSRYPECEIKLFGFEKDPQLSFEYTYFQDPQIECLTDLYCSSDIFVFTSYGEGWGMTPLEAMICKCAVVGTKVGSIATIYNGKNVFIVEPKDAMDTYRGLHVMYTNKYLREQIANEGYETASNFSWLKSGKKLEAAFMSILNNY